MGISGRKGLVHYSGHHTGSMAQGSGCGEVLYRSMRIRRGHRQAAANIGQTILSR